MNSKKTSLPQSHTHHEVEPTHPLLLFISQHARNLLLAMVGIIVLLGFTLKMSSIKQGRGELDFNKAMLLASQLNGDPETVAELKKLIKRHPELQTKYVGALAHSELKLNASSDTVELASQLIAANSLFDQHPALAPLKRYSQTSLLITSGQLEQALEASLRLQRSLEDEVDLDYLLTLNTLRIASLYQQTRNHAEEEAWLTQLEQRLLSHSSGMVTHFQAGAISLRDYIEQRKEKLQQIL